MGRRIKVRRESAGLTQTVLGEAIGKALGQSWPRQAVSAAEKGRRAFTAAEVVAIADALGCGISDLFGVTDSVAPGTAGGLWTQASLSEIRRMQSFLTGREQDLAKRQLGES